MGQDIIVGVIVALCAALVVWRLVRRLRGGRGSGCSCSDASGGTQVSSGCSGCEGCALVEQCKVKPKQQ